MLKIIDMRNGGESELFEKLAGRGRIGSDKIVRAAEEIVENVRKRGDEAVLEYTEKFDGVKLDETSMKVSGRKWRMLIMRLTRKWLKLLKNPGPT